MRIKLSVISTMLLFGTPAAPQQIVSSGTGFFVNAEGWVLTNRHVIEGCSNIRINGVDIVGSPVSDRVHDLAAMQTATLSSQDHLTFRGVPARLAEPLFVLGFPLSDLLSASIKATDGTVSSLAGAGNDISYLQISAPVQPGNSGGPVIDTAGRVLGVATGILSEEAYDRAQNVNFAIKAEMAIAFLNANSITYDVDYTDIAGRDPVSAVADASKATVYITCHEIPSQSPPAASLEGSSSGPVTFQTFPGYDAIGYDYRTIRDVTLSECSDACLADAACNAYTLNTRHDFCFLKSGAFILVRNSDAMSAVYSGLVPELFTSNMTVRANVDSPGGDYARIRDADFVQCLLECGTDLRCRAFAFVRQTNDCWLKERIGPIVSMPGVEFGSFE